MTMDPSLTIVLLGHTGVGKSASGNTILGKTAFESEDAFGSVSNKISKESEQVFQKMITVIDTPGILESDESVNLIETLCQGLIRAGSPRLFLVVVKIDRFTDEPKKAVEAAIRVIGDEELNNSYMLFTRGDSLKGKTLDDFININPDGPLKALVERFAGKHVFNNENGGQDQVRQLLLKSGHLRADAHPMVERRIILLGLPGDGKSASGNTILGLDRFRTGGGFSVVTTETKGQKVQVEGCNVTVVDTPGFTLEVLTTRQLYKEIVKAISEASPGPHAIVIVVRIGRISEANIKLFEILPELFGKNSVKYTMILFTYGDQLTNDQSIADLIRAEKSLSKLVDMCGQRYCVFNNTQKANRQQVGTLLRKVDVMVKANRKQEHLAAGMFYEDQSFLFVKMPVWAEEAKERFLKWLNQQLEALDCCRSGYSVMSNAPV